MTEQITVKVPNLGGAKGAIIEILVHPGDKINKDTSLVTLESDKASMEIPATTAGIVKKLLVKLGDQVGEGDDLLILNAPSKPQATQPPAEVKPTATVTYPATTANKQPEDSSLGKKLEPIILAAKQSQAVGEMTPSDEIYAGPAVRRMARELGIELKSIKGSGPKKRITIEDLKNYLSIIPTKEQKKHLSAPPATIDFSQFGEIEVKPLSKIKRLTGINIVRAWSTIPQVTQFDIADLTDLEDFRCKEISKHHQQDYKLTILSFVAKVVCQALRIFPQFNTSLDGDNLIYKNYYNIGFAAETPTGLLVPVIKNCAQLSITEIAQQMSILSKKARTQGLTPAEMSGGCFTISSLGGIGGTAFTPIVNSPEVAILGLSRASIQPVYDGNTWQPRLMLPLSLSYDHRVIDGAEAARFTRFIAELLTDLRRVLI